MTFSYNSDSFIAEWFANPDWWFNQSDTVDEYLTQKYQYLLDEKISNNFHAIIVYDQLVRHIFRHTQSHHIISFFQNKALTLINDLDLDSLSPTEWCFAMLPLRHTNDPEKIHIVMKLSWEKLNTLKNQVNTDNSKKDIEQIQKFLKATYERCPIFDQSKFILKYNPSNKDNNIDTCQYNPEEFKHFLRNCPLEKPITIKYNDYILQNVQTILTNYNPKKIIMSLSGGVDSVVSLWILKHLQPIFNFDMEIVTINYCNRKISDDEQKFATKWALSLGYNVNVRRIEEIRREPCMQNDMRNIYESYTRNIRYATYKTIDPDAYVILGHNKDDSLENIFQNISHNTKYEELRGMQYLVVQDNIKFLRPLLDISKDDIIQFANEHNIPYLPNSTPEWSQRGQIRNKVIPCLNSWNSDLIPGLYDLAKIVKEMHSITLAFVSNHVNLYKKTDTGYIANIEIDIFNTIKESEIYWKTLIDKLTSIKISKRSLRSFLERLSNSSYSSNINDVLRFNLKKNLQIIIKNKDIIISIEVITI